VAESNPNSNPPLSSDASFAHCFLAKRNLIFVLALLAAIFWTIFYLQFTADDAFISFRYGKNLVAHHVWNWNPPNPHEQAPREEAYTSFLYTALSIVPALLHMSPSLFFKLFGVACIGAMLYRLRTVAQSPFAVLLGLLLIAVHPWVWLHAFAGLETPLYMLLLLEMAIAVLNAANIPPRWVYTLFLLLPLTRPEGIVFACVGVVFFWRARGSAPKNYAAFVVAFCLGLLYFLARWRYFHHPLPNPYYTKLTLTSSLDKVRNLITNLAANKGYFLVLLLIAGFARKAYTRIFALCGILLMLLLYAPHNMQMNYADRFYFQITFPIVLFFLLAEDLIPIARGSAAIAALSLLFITSSYLSTSLEYWPLRTQSDVDLAHRLAPFAPGHTLLTPNAGAIPYYSNWIAYDFFGLGTYNIARYRVSVPLLQKLHPDLILVESPNPGPGVLNEQTYPDKQAEIDFLKQSPEYEYVGQSGHPGEYNIEFLRRDTPRHDEIVRALQQNMRSSAMPHLSLRDLLTQRYVRWSD
jgi:arabinofuranosyltransferase